MIAPSFVPITSSFMTNMYNHMYNPTVSPPLFSSSPTRPDSSTSSRTPPSTPQSPAVTCELAARLLFVNSRWVETLDSFNLDKVALLSGSWRDLFVLSCGHFLSLSDISSLVAASNLQSEETVLNIKIFEEIIARINMLELDSTEFTCLRLILLFHSNQSLPGVSELLSQAQSTLLRFISLTKPEQPMRFRKLLLLLPALSSVSSTTVQELFFKSTMGDVPIDNVVVDIFKNSTQSL